MTDQQLQNNDAHFSRGEEEPHDIVSSKSSSRSSLAELVEVKEDEVHLQAQDVVKKEQQQVAPQSSKNPRVSEDNIKVVCRFRPLTKNELKKAGKIDKQFIGHAKSTVVLTDPTNSDNTLDFKFDRVFDEDSKQEAIYLDVGEPIVEASLEGYNSTIFAYGQTGSGKTYTMEGTEEDLGLVPRVVSALFQGIESSPDHMEYNVSVSMIEIYNERVNDLLDIQQSNLQIREDPEHGIWVDGARTEHLTRADEILNVMRIGQKNRATASTKMNNYSSRSHSLFMVTVQQRNLHSLSTKSAKLFLVDLAGSEKVRKTGATGTRLEEAKKINKSLSTLGSVINALTDGKSSHIPYRDSKLTRVLQESLGGNAKTALVVCCSGSKFNYMETVSTLRFAARAKLIKNKAKVNQEFSGAELKILLAKAQQEIVMLRSTVAELNHGKSGLVDLFETQLVEKSEQLAREQIVHEEAIVELQNKLKHVERTCSLKEEENEQLRQKLEAQKPLEDQIQSLLKEVSRMQENLEVEIRQKLEARDKEECLKLELQKMTTEYELANAETSKLIAQYVESLDEVEIEKKAFVDEIARLHADALRVSMENAQLLEKYVNALADVDEENQHWESKFRKLENKVGVNGAKYEQLLESNEDLNRQKLELEEVVESMGRHMAPEEMQAIVEQHREELLALEDEYATEIVDLRKNLELETQAREASQNESAKLAQQIVDLEHHIERQIQTFSDESDRNQQNFERRIHVLEYELSMKTKENETIRLQEQERLDEEKQRFQQRERDLQRSHMEAMTKLRDDNFKQIEKIQLEEERLRQCLEKQLGQAKTSTEKQVVLIQGTGPETERLEKETQRLRAIIEMQEQKLARRDQRIKVFEKKFGIDEDEDDSTCLDEDIIRETMEEGKEEEEETEVESNQGDLDLHERVQRLLSSP